MLGISVSLPVCVCDQHTCVQCMELESWDQLSNLPWQLSQSGNEYIVLVAKGGEVDIADKMLGSMQRGCTQL